MCILDFVASVIQYDLDLTQNQQMTISGYTVGDQYKLDNLRLAIKIKIGQMV